MKRILVILSILMITGVSAQKITNLKVYSNYFNTAIIVQWDAKGANASRYQLKGEDTWHGGKKGSPDNHTYGFAIPKRNVKNRTYKLNVNKNKASRKVVIAQIMGNQIGGSLTSIKFRVHGVFSKKYLYKTFYIGPDNVKGKLQEIEDNGDGTTNLNFDLVETPSNFTHDFYRDYRDTKQFIWYKQGI